MRIGVDLGGTKIEAVALAETGREAARLRVRTPSDGYEAVLGGIRDLVTAVERSVGAADSVGVGTPGFISPEDGLIRNANLTCLNGRALDGDLERALGRPVRVANDANCFVLSEAMDGAAAWDGVGAAEGVDIVFGATLGTGVGGGLVVNGHVLTGANGSAAEWSHTTLPFLRPEESSPYVCFCGHQDCIESFISGRGLAADHRRTTGQDIDAPEIARRAAIGDEAALATFERYEDRLARALSGVINIVDPRAIVLGGGVSNNERIFLNVPRIWDRYTVAKQLRTRLVRAAHGDASGARGAAWLWPAVQTAA